MLLNSGAFHKIIEAPQVSRFNNSAQKQLLYPDEPMEMHLASNSSEISHHVLHLPLILTDDSSEAFITPMHKLVNKYAGIFTKPGKPII